MKGGESQLNFSYRKKIRIKLFFLLFVVLLILFLFVNTRGCKLNSDLFD